MSWGERSCKYFGGSCPTTPTIEKCNVDCVYYESNGKKPDSQKSKTRTQRVPNVFTPQPEPISRELKNYIDVVCRDGAGVRLRAGWDPAYKATIKEVIKCLRK